MLLDKRGTASDVRTSAVRKDLLRVRQEPWVPDAEQDPGSQLGFPVIVRGNDGVHEVKQPRRVVLHLDVNVKLYVAVLGLNT